MEIASILLNLTIKDWFIIVTLSLLIVCIFQIRRLKHSLVQEIQRRLIPQLKLDSDLNDFGLFITNEGYFLARDVNIEDLKINLKEFGIEFKMILKFEPIDTLKPNERTKLKFKVIHKQEEISADITGKIIFNLKARPTKIKIFYANIENIKFAATFITKRENFLLERIEFLK